MYITRARAILLRHPKGDQPTTDRLISPGDLQLMTELRLDRSVPAPDMPAPGGVEWTSVPIGESHQADGERRAGPATSAWDAAHALVEHTRIQRQPAARTAIGPVALDDATYAEPDFLFSMPPPQAKRVATSVEPCQGKPGQWKCMWPPLASSNAGVDWFLGHSGLASARTKVSFPPAGTQGVRIAHLDTGYNPKHQGLPRRLRGDLGRDLTVSPPGSTAYDPGVSRPVLSSPGHGTGTVCILAGGHCSLTDKDLGGAPEAEILPVRISDYVWHIWTSVIPKGIDYARANGAHVISLSHGGLPTRAWADAVNAAYEAGIVICAATGDNFGGLPYRSVVWPARYARTIGVAGVTFDRDPYFNPDFGPGVLEGNFGPEEDMGHVIAAFTPNVPWALCRVSVDGTLGDYVTDGYDLDGGGTSASTPQVAAAVALYLQAHWVTLGSINDWRRVEVVRAALRNSAAPASSGALYTGMGILNADALLEQDPGELLRTVVKVDAAIFKYTFLTAQPGWPDVPEGQQRMLEIELTHIALSNTGLWQAVNAWQGSDAGVSDPQFQKLRDAFLDSRSPRASKRLRDLLTS